MTDTSWGSMAPLRATILVTCWAQAEDTSAEGSLMSKAKPAKGMKRKDKDSRVPSPLQSRLLPYLVPFTFPQLMAPTPPSTGNVPC